MPNAVRTHVARGVDPEHFQAPLVLHRAQSGRVLHGDEECQRESRRPLVREERSPLGARDLCPCWEDALPGSSRTRATLRAAEALAELETELSEALKEHAKSPTRLVAALRTLQGELAEVSDPAGASTWRSRLEAEVGQQVRTLEEELQAPERRDALLLTWALHRMESVEGEPLPYEEAYTLAGEELERAEEVTLSARRAWTEAATDGTTPVERAERVREALLCRVEVGGVTLNQVAHLQIGTPPPGTSVGEHLEKLWEGEVTRIAHLLAEQWESELEALLDPEHRTLVVLPRLGSPVPEEDLALVEAWRRGVARERVVVLAPDVVADQLGQHGRGARRPLEVTLEATDTDDVVETALTLWSDDTGPLGRLEDALDAARRL